MPSGGVRTTGEAAQAMRRMTQTIQSVVRMKVTSRANFWIDRGTQVVSVNGEKGTSLIIDPPNGKIPPLSATRRKELEAQRTSRGPSDGPETRTLSDRCLLAFGSSSGPPMLPVLYNSHFCTARPTRRCLLGYFRAPFRVAPM